MSDFKFKVGDRVKYVGVLSPWWKGCSGTVVEIISDQDIRVKWDAVSAVYTNYASSLERIDEPRPFAVGDRVVYIGTDMEKWRGWIGTVKCLGNIRDHIKVSWDNEPGSVLQWVRLKNLAHYAEPEQPAAPPMTDASWHDLLHQAEQQAGKQIAELRSELEQQAKRFASMTLERNVWLDGWHTMKDERDKLAEQMSDLRAELDRVIDLHAENKKLVAERDALRQERDTAYDELATAKQAMAQQESEIQRACGLLREIPQHMAIGHYDELHAWERRAKQFLADCDAGPSYAKG